MTLQIGQMFENYNALCAFLQEEPKTGGARKNQLKNWETYFAFKKFGHKIEIVQVFKPFSEISERERKQREGIFIQEISLQLLNSLSEIISRNKTSLNQDTNCHLIIQLKDDMIKYGLCHENYKKLKKIPADAFLPSSDRKLLSEIEKLRTLSVGETFASSLEQRQALFTTKEVKFTETLNQDLSSEIWSKGKELFLSALTNLNSRHFISFQYTYLITKAEPFSSHIASLDEINLIETVNVEVLTFFGLKEIKTVRAKGLSFEFYTKRNEILFQRYKFKAERVYDVAFTPIQIEFADSYKQSLNSLTLAKTSLNEKMYAYFTKTYSKKELSSFDKNAVSNMMNFAIKGEDVFA